MTTQDRAAELAKEYQIIRDNIFNDMGNRPAGWKDFPIEKAVEWININVEAFRRLIAAHPEWNARPSLPSDEEIKSIINKHIRSIGQATEFIAAMLNDEILSYFHSLSENKPLQPDKFTERNL